MSDAPRQLSEDEFRKMVLEGLGTLAGLMKDLLTQNQAAIAHALTQIVAAKAAAERDRESDKSDPSAVVC